MRWVNKPPVYVVTDQEFATYAEAYMEDLKSWKAKGKKDDEQRAWNDDIQRRINEADVYGQPGVKVVYKLASGPAALMRLSVKDDSVKIEDLSAHKGAEGSGVVMVEWAVNYSQREGKGGLLSLYDASNSPGYYAGVYGFETVDGGTMKLDPAKKPELWVRLNDTWKLKKYVTAEGKDKFQFLEDPPGELEPH